MKNNKYIPSKHFLASLFLIFASFLIFQFLIIPDIENSQLAQVINLRQPVTPSITPSKEVPGTFIFNWNMARISAPRDSAYFDAPILPFDEERERALLERDYGHVDFGPIRDAWGYPIRENIYNKIKTELKAEEMSNETYVNRLKSSDGAPKNLDEDPNNLGIYNCRANTSVTGYFKAYFEDVALDNNIGFDHPIHGESRRQTACQALQDLSELLMLDTTTVTPDILFMRSDTPMPPGALAGASSYFNNSSYLDNGTLHKHIITRQDPTPGTGFFDAFIITNFNGVTWSSDTPLAQGVYDMHTVMTHELMHALGFRGSLPPVTTQTNTSHQYGTFDYFSYQNDTLQNPFINHITKLLNVPIGAPSPWFISNNVVYRGVKNILNANPDGIRPIYSPTSWQQGSSLSHFDMNRAPGEVYVMHPSIGQNTERDIHDHEEEVLCHLGYMVLGMEGCEVPSPVAVDDFVVLDETNSACINLLANDINHGSSWWGLTVNTFESISIQPGDTIEYFINPDGCTGSPSQNSFGAIFIRLILTPDPSPRVFEYTNRNINTNKISFPARITTVPSCESITDPYEYVCNGGFELAVLNTSQPDHLLCGNSWNSFQNVPFWCNWAGSPDIFNYSISNFPWIGGAFECDNCSGGLRLVDIVRTKHPLYWDVTEGLLTQLKVPLVSGQEYKISFDVFARASNSSFVYDGQTWNYQSELIDSVYVEAQLNSGPQLTLGPVIYPLESVILTQNIPLNTTPNSFTTIEQTFVPNDNYDFLGLMGDFTGSGIQNIIFVFDNISIRPVNAPPPPSSHPAQTTGTIYQDLNQNGVWNTQAEPGLPGISVHLFEPGNATPIQTVTTEGLPNTGKYTFSNLQDGTYYIALQGENIYPLITEPSSNNVLPGYNHARSVTITNGQTVENQNFGVALTGDFEPIYGCTNPQSYNYNPLANTDDGSCITQNPDHPQPLEERTNVSVRKLLHDGTLSIFDRKITWYIMVYNYGPETATNIVVTDIFPQGLTYDSHEMTNPNETYNPQTNTFHIPSLAPNSAASMYLTMRVPYTACGIKTNRAVLTSLDQTDTNNADNKALAYLTTLPACSSTSVSKF